MKEYQIFLDFWFSESVEKLWFNSTPEFDEELKIKFEPMYLRAFNGEHDDWLENTKGALAQVILFDQLPLNIYRKKPESFQSEARAREVSSIVIENKWDDDLSDTQKAFLYMPFMHSEDLQDQQLSLALFEKAGLMDNLKYAKHHFNIIKQFGRFPHRNAILGRENSKEEIAYLSSKEAFLG